MEKYNPKSIESKWQRTWEDNQQFAAHEDSKKEKFYGLVEFPYPSGEGLHVGHPLSYIAMDVICHYKRFNGKSVLYPIGFDSFGLPAENFAIKKGINPAIVTKNNIKTYTKQIKSLGFSFDWQRSLSTTDPEYYKWTQWIFIQMFKHGLAYKNKQAINWCLDCKIGLANEEVVNGVCERCGGEVVKKEKEQWMLKITEYADRLIDDLDQTDYLDKIKIQQKNWIGRSEGINIDYQVVDSDLKLTCYTTTPVNFGASFLVISPEHPLVDQLTTTGNKKQVQDYIKQSQKKADLERTMEKQEKTGVETGSFVLNHVTGEKIPVWVADFVLMTVGTGAVQGCPGHDKRDFEFAKKYNLPIKRVVVGEKGETDEITEIEKVVEKGIKSKMINSDFLDGMDFQEAMQKTMDHFEKKGWGKRTVNFKLRDWVFSRQRYWGEPIPMVYCEVCGWQPISEKELPLVLPEVEKYEPTDDGESPLSQMTDWVNTKCPKCGAQAKRETDTMPNWAGSNWYFLRYCDPKNNKELADKKKLEYWGPVDWYNGGMEHTTLHLLYSRFVYKFLYDINAVPKKCGVEPYKKRTSHGMVLGEGGVKMSKSKGNVINPDDVVKEFGADAFRLYEMFMGPFDQDIPWDTKGIVGVKRFIDKVFEIDQYLVDKEPENVTRELHKTIKKVGEDIEVMGFNTAIAQMMIFINLVIKEKQITTESLNKFLTLLAPFAPHVAEEINQNLENKESVFENIWPVFDEKLIVDLEVKIAVQVNGKVRATIVAPASSPEGIVLEIAKEDTNIIKFTKEKEIKKVIYIQDRLLNIVV